MPASIHQREEDQQQEHPPVVVEVSYDEPIDITLQMHQQSSVQGAAIASSHNEESGKKQPSEPIATNSLENQGTQSEFQSKFNLPTDAEIDEMAESVLNQQEEAPSRSNDQLTHAVFFRPGS